MRDEVVMDRMFALLPALGLNVLSVDRDALVVRLGATDGREVSVRFSSEITCSEVRRVEREGDLDWLLPAPADERVFRLMVLHLEESIYAYGRAHAVEYVQVLGGFDPVDGVRFPIGP